MDINLSPQTVNFVELVATGDATTYRPSQEELSKLQKLYFQACDKLKKPAEWNLRCSSCKIQIMKDIYTVFIVPERKREGVRMVKRVTPESQAKPLNEMSRQELIQHAKTMGKMIPRNATKDQLKAVINGNN